MVQNHIKLNWLSDTIKKREMGDETLEESETKESLYMNISRQDFECKQLLEIIAPDEKVKERYMEPVSRAQAIVEFPADYKLTHWVNRTVPKEALQHSIKSIILKETKSKKNQPIKKVDEWINTQNTIRERIAQDEALFGRRKRPG